MNTKTFSTKSNVRRANKHLVEGVDYTIVGEGKEFAAIAIVAVETVVEAETTEVEAGTVEMYAPVLDGGTVYGFSTHGLTHCPACGVHLSNGVGSHDHEDSEAHQHTEFQFACLACDHEFGPAIEPVKAKVSTIERPCRAVWVIADELTAAGPTSRKAIIEECVKRGVAFYTARTQYQQWRALRVKID